MCSACETLVIPCALKSVCVQREDLETELEKAAHYVQFAVAAYGWPIYVYLNPLTGFCKLSGDWYAFSDAPQQKSIFESLSLPLFLEFHCMRFIALFTCTEPLERLYLSPPHKSISSLYAILNGSALRIRMACFISCSS